MGEEDYFLRVVKEYASDHLVEVGGTPTVITKEVVEMFNEASDQGFEVIEWDANWFVAKIWDPDDEELDPQWWEFNCAEDGGWGYSRSQAR